MQQVTARRRPPRQSTVGRINQSERLRAARLLGYLEWSMPDEVCDQDAAIERARDRLVSAWSAQCESDGRLRVVLGTIDGVSFVLAATPSDPSMERLVVNTFRRLEGRRPLRFEGTLHGRSITRDLALKIADELVAADRRRRAG